MFENNIQSIMKAQEGNEEEMTKLIEANNRINLEYSKKIYGKRL